MAPNKLSYRSLIDAKIIKRTDNGMAALPTAIRIREGFNLRDVTAEDYRTDIDALKAHLKRGGKVPALEVVLADDGFQGVDVVDGHRRLTAYQELIAEGDPIEWIRIEPFTGNMLDQVTRIMTSQEGRKLTALEVASGYARLIAFQLTPDDIARRVGKTRQHVDQMLILASAPHGIQQMVKAGTVSATQAVIEIRQIGGRAAEAKLAAATTATGGRKVTAKALKPWTPPAKVVVPTLTALESFLESVPPGERVLIECADTQPEGTVTVNAKELRDLFNAFGAVNDARLAAEQKAREKANQAAQGELAGTEGA
jgi:hypothetical protein